MKKNFISNLFRSAISYGEQHSPMILGVMAVSGIALTGFLSYKAGIKAKDVIANHKKEMEDATNSDEEKKLKIKHVKNMASIIAPPIIMGLASAACVIGSNHINNKRLVALSAAYSLAESSVKDLNGKMQEMLGQKKTQAIKDAIAKDKLDAKPYESSKTEVIYTGKGDTLCKDMYSGRFFKSNPQKIEEAINSVSAACLNEMYVSLNDLYDVLGLERIKLGDDIGWNTDDLAKGRLPIQYSCFLTEDNEPVLCVEYDIGIRKDFRKLY